MNLNLRLIGVGLGAFLLVFAGSYRSAIGQDGQSGSVEQLSTAECNPSLSDDCARLRHQLGRRLFDVETFGGNGRTCRTCHTKKNGTFSPEEARTRLAEDPNDPLFLHDGLDDGVAGTSRITEHGTVRIEIPLPSDVTLADDPARRSVIVNRGTPTTMNTPTFDRLLMYDTREPNLQQQAFNAIRGHAQSTRLPNVLELDLIREFQQTDSRFFSSDELQGFANGAAPPRLPSGSTESETRGAAMFADGPFIGRDASQRLTGLCTTCHAGPMLNQFGPNNGVGPPGGRRADILVSQTNLIGNPVYSFVVTNLDGSVVVVDSPDPGVMLNMQLPAPPPGSGFPPQPRSFFANVFKIPTLWGVERTAPYFHDNSAKTLEDVAAHYATYFRDTPRFGFEFTVQDQSDMVAFLKLLR
jgi:cytochrome c peroxidase